MYLDRLVILIKWNMPERKLANSDNADPPLVDLPFAAAKHYNRMIRNQMKHADKYYILDFEEPRVYGIFMTLKGCKKALMEQKWDMCYMGLPNPDTNESRGSDTVIGIVMRGRTAIQTEEVDDAPPLITMQRDDWQKCMERTHLDLEYVGAFRATANTCAKL